MSVTAVCLSVKCTFSCQILSKQHESVSSNLMHQCPARDSDVISAGSCLMSVSCGPVKHTHTHRTQNPRCLFKRKSSHLQRAVQKPCWTDPNPALWALNMTEDLWHHDRHLNTQLHNISQALQHHHIPFQHCACKTSFEHTNVMFP